MEEQEYGDLLQKAYDFQLALVSNPRISPEDFSSVQREAKEIFKDMEGVYRPWLGRSKEDRQKKEVAEFKQQWKSLAGFDPDDRDALDKWSDSLAEHSTKVAERVAAEQKAEQERMENYTKRLADIKAKRSRQQGRK